MCGFRHCLTLEEYTLLFKDPQPNLIATGSGISQQSTNAAGHQSQPQSQTTKRICAFFVKGTCKNGESCPYYHDTAFTRCPNFQSRGFCNDSGCSYCSTDKQHPANDQPLPAPSAKRCQYWPMGTCRNGDACGFAHIGEPGVAARNDQNENGGQVVDNTQNGVQVVDNTEDASGFNQGDGWANNNDETARDGNQMQDGYEEKEAEAEGGATEEDQWAKGWAHGNANDATGWDTTNLATSGWDDQTNGNNELGKGNNGASGWDRDRGNSNKMENNDSGRRNHQSDTHKSWNRDKSTGVCRGFQQGQCFRGSRCRFSHGVELGGGSGRDPREASQQYPSKKNSTYTTQPEEDVETSSHLRTSKLGGRYQYDRESIKDWNTEVAKSEVGSEADDGVGKQSGWRSREHRSPDPRRAFSNRSVENPPAGDSPCQFCFGRCSNGDVCTFSHDAAAVGNFEDLPGEERRRFRSREVQNDGLDVKGKGILGKGVGQDECTPHAPYEAKMANDDVVSRVEHKRESDKQRDDKPVVGYEHFGTDERQHHEQGYLAAGVSGHYQPLDPKRLVR